MWRFGEKAKWRWNQPKDRIRLGYGWALESV